MEKQKTTFHWMSILVCCAVLVLSAVLLVPQMINNDDMVIHSITAGVFGEKSPQLAHTHLLYGNLLVALQQLVPSLNWFEVLQVLWLSLAFLAMAWIIADANPGWVGLALSAGYSIFVVPYFINELHNTKAMPLVGFIGLLCVVQGIRKKKLSWVLLGLLLSLATALVRWHSFLIGAIFAAGLCAYELLFRFLPDKEESGKVWRRVVTFALVLGVVFAVNQGEGYLPQANDNLADYRQYNGIRGGVSDFVLPSYEEHYVDYVNAGISPNDLRMIETWNFADMEKFDEPTLQAIAALRANRSFQEKLFGVWQDNADTLLKTPFLWVALGICVLLLVVAKDRNKLPVLWSVLAAVLCLVLMAMMGRATRWILYGLGGCMVSGAFFSLKEEEGKGTKWIAVLLLPLLLGYDVYSYRDQMTGYAESFNYEAGQVYRELRKDEENLYLMSGTSYRSLERLYPTFSAVEEGLMANQYYLGGWDTNSEAKNSILLRYGVDPATSPFRGMLNQNNVFLVDVGDWEMFRRFIRENYDSDATLSMVDVVGGFFVYGACPGELEAGTQRLRTGEGSFHEDGEIQSYVYFQVSFQGSVEEGTAGFIRLTDTKEQVRTYRGKLWEEGDGYVLSCRVPITDFDTLTFSAIQPILRQQSGTMICGEMVPFR